MAVALLASQCPPVQTWSGILSVAGGGTSPNGNAPSQEPVVAAQTAISPTLRRNQTRVDLIGRYGGGLFGIAAGLAISISGPGLALAVSAGHAMCSGVMAIEANTSVNVPDETGRVWIWLQQGTPVGGPLLRYTIAIPPTAPAGQPGVLLGSCSTGGGNILSVDTSGVMYLRGAGWRQTADVGAPTDTPPSGVQFVAVTLGGTYWWDGAAYHPFTAASVVSDSMALAQDCADRLDIIERKFRALIFVLTDLFSEDILLTDELQEDFEMASEEV